MEVTEYLKQNGIGKLVTEFSIKVKEYDEGLIVLNYNQIDSPKAHPIVLECRGLILDKEYNVVSRSFDRFFNLGEQPDTQKHIDMSKAVCYEKIDGSLIRIYNWKGVWYVATRGTAFAESDVNGFPVTFKDLVFKALEVADDAEFQQMCNCYLDPDITYIGEMTSAENRVVRSYAGYTLHYLAARNNKTFEFVDCSAAANDIGMKQIAQYKFDTTEACIETAKHLKDLDEGYVLYQDGIPMCKIKSPVYVAVHNIRGEGLSPKRIAQIVLSGETDEYLRYFPEDEKFFLPYFEAHKTMMASLMKCYEDTKHIEDQKTFALTVKDNPYSAVLFQCKKKGSLPSVTFNEQSEPHKIRMLSQFISVEEVA